jgi:hypothetical protein
MFERYGVLSKRELESRQEVYLEQYVKSVATEARTAIEMARTIIFPAAMRYQGQLAATCVSLKALGYKFDTLTLDKITALVAELQDGIAALEVTMARHDFARYARPRQARLRRDLSRDVDAAEDGRRARGHRCRRPLAAGHLPGDALHQVGSAVGPRPPGLAIAGRPLPLRSADEPTRSGTSVPRLPESECPAGPLLSELSTVGSIGEIFLIC